MTEIPQQYVGNAVDVTDDMQYDTIAQAQEAYSRLKNNLLNMDKWKDFSGTLSANFSIYGENNNPVQRNVQKGDFIRINIPGPGNPSGEGDDWVKVYEINEKKSADAEQISITVHPAPCPLNNDKDVAHFFSEKSSSTFVAGYEQKRLFAEVHCRNEIPNNKDVEISDKIRNSLVATGGIAGFSNLQWKLLTSGLIKSIKE